MPLSTLFHTHRSPTAVRVMPLKEFEQGASFFPQWQGVFEQLSLGRFTGKLSVVRAEIIRVVKVETNQRVLLRGRDAGGLCSVFPVVAGNAGNLWHGQR
jgi:hypothetical protein